MRTHRDEGTSVPVPAQRQRLSEPAAPVAARAATVSGAAGTSTVFVVSRCDPPAHLQVSAGFESITGLPGDAVIADPTALTRLVHPADLGAAASWLQQFWSGRPAEVEMRLIRPDGELRWVRLAATPLTVGDQAQMVTALDDVTERVAAVEAARSAEAAARAAHDAKSLLISRMNHELRTPLNAVIGFGQLLERRLTDPDDHSSVQHILSSGRHLLAMIDGVLDVSRIGAGNLSLTIEPVDAPSLIDEVVQLAQPAAGRAGVMLAVERGPADTRLLGDRGRLVQVLHTLLTSAIDGNRRGGSIRVSWSAVGGASVTILDDGDGLRPDTTRGPSTPPGRLDDGGTSVAGTPVKLPIARALVELMNGAVSVESVPGVGTSFTVRLPAAPDRLRATGSADAVSTPAREGTGWTTMLYIEDNEPNVRVVASLLRLRPAWKLLHAGSGTAGLAIARSSTPDVVLLDLHLPDCFGLSVLEALKADPATAGIPVIILSADASQTQVDRLLQAGAAQYLTKPLDVREVLMLLDDITADQVTRLVDA